MNLSIALLLTGCGVFFTWLIAHIYYKKSLTEQENEFFTARNALIEALKEANPHAVELATQQYIDKAVSAWKQAGTPVHYLNSLTDVSNEEKAKIFHAATIRHKNREPKNNPYDRPNGRK